MKNDRMSLNKSVRGKWRVARGVARSGRRLARRTRRRVPFVRKRRDIRSARCYWDARYASKPTFVSSGHIALSDEENQRDFLVRAEILRETLKRLRIPDRDRLLDAACGDGLFGKMCLDLGFVTTAFDLSGEAIAQARERIGDVCEWSVAAIESFRSSRSFDFVICLSSLMCIVTDNAHMRAFRNLASLTAHGGYLIVEEMLVPSSEAAPAAASWTHVRKRAVDVYEDLIVDTNLELTEHIRFQIPLAGQERSLVIFRAAAQHTKELPSRF